MVQAVDIGVGILESHTVGKQTDVFLELLKGRFGVRAKVAIVLAAGKPKTLSAFYQGLHVGAMKWAYAGKGAVAQLIRGVDGALQQGMSTAWPAARPLSSLKVLTACSVVAPVLVGDLGGINH